MSKKILFPLIGFFLIVSVFFSCEKEDHDNVKPTLSIQHPSANANLHVGSVYLFEATFQDDKALSSYIIQVSNPAIENDKRLIVNPNDSTKRDSLVYLNQIIQRANIFNIKDTAITVSHSFVLDSMTNYEGRGPFYAVTGTYQFKVVVMDRAGNRDSSYFDVNVLPPLTD